MVWKTINEALRRRRSNHVKPSKLLNPNGTHVNSLNDVCETFNDYFVNIGAELGQACPDVCDVDAQYSQNESGVELNNFEIIEAEELQVLIQDINSNKSFGVDKLHPKLLKLAIRAITKPLLYIFNLSLRSGIVPALLKTARVTPVYKGAGSPYSPNNYRPISNLPVCAKLLEKLVYSRINKAIGSCIYNLQYGFRKAMSTSDALNELVDTLNDNLNNGNVNLGVFIDLKKAFDTVNHDILISKLKGLGLKGNAILWLEDYLKGRSQFVQIESVQSSYQAVTIGVPQGSNLGPLLFLFYINDIHKHIKHGTVRLFADDTNIFYHGKDQNLIVQQANEDMARLNRWLCANKLTPNLSKSTYIIIATPNIKIASNFEIHLKGTRLERVKSVKYLGVMIDERLNWKEHINSVCAKISPVIGVLSKLRWVLPKRICKQIYMSLVHCHTMYCLEVWGCATKLAMNPLITLQKKVIRIISFSSYLAHTDDLFKTLRLMDVRKSYFYKICVLVYKEINQITMCKKYGLKFIRHRYSTRRIASKKLDLPSVKGKTSNYVLRCFKFIGPRCFNILPDCIRDCISIKKFKEELKKYCIFNELDVYNILYPHKEY